MSTAAPRSGRRGGRRRRERPLRAAPGHRQPLRPLRRQRPRCRVGRSDRGLGGRGDRARRRVADASPRPRRPRREGARLRAVLRAGGRLRARHDRPRGRLRLRGRRARCGERREPAVGCDPRRARRSSRSRRAKLLADELEELEAVRALAAIRTDDVEASMREVAAVAARVALLRGRGGLRRGRRPARARQRRLGPESDGDRRRGGVARRARRPPLPVLRPGRGGRAAAGAARPASPASARTTCSSSTGAARGVLFVAHTDAGPRGFTLLCRRLGVRLAGVASAQLGVALTQSGALKRLHVCTRPSGSSTA